MGLGLAIDVLFHNIHYHETRLLVQRDIKDIRFIMLSQAQIVVWYENNEIRPIVSKLSYNLYRYVCAPLISFFFIFC